MKISIIVAISTNNVIGKDNDLPWHLPNDMKFFRETTKGHIVIMGRRNWDSIPLEYRPLKGRTNVILTHNRELQAPGCIIAHSMPEAMEKVKDMNDKDIFIIGGRSVYEFALDGLADKIYLTRVHAEIEGDVLFPPVDLEKGWRLVSQKDFQPDEKHKHPYSFLEYERVR